MKRVQQRSIEHADCGVACVAMLAGSTYKKAFEAFGFVDDQHEFYTRHHHLNSALEALGCKVKSKLFRSWHEIGGPAIVAVNHTQDGRYWHWVAFDGEAILDPKPNRPGRKRDFRGIRGSGFYIAVL